VGLESEGVPTCKEQKKILGGTDKYRSCKGGASRNQAETKQFRAYNCDFAGTRDSQFLGKLCKKKKEERVSRDWGVDSEEITTFRERIGEGRIIEKGGRGGSEIQCRKVKMLESSFLKGKKGKGRKRGEWGDS